MGTDHDRRWFLHALAGSGSLALAGCADGSAGARGDDQTTEEPSTTSSRTRTDTPQHTETQTPPPQTHMSTVFHFAANAGEQKHALANVTNLLDDASTDLETVALVANGPGIRLLGSETSEHPDRVAALLERGVSFRACENSMAAFDMEESDLVDGVETVPAGVGELTKLQARDGFAYIRIP